MGKNALRLIISGLILGANWAFLFEAYKHTSIAVATISYYVAPVILAVLSALFLKERPALRKLVCIGVSIIGVAMVSGIFTGGANGADTMLGVKFGLAAAASYAVLTVINKTIKDIPPLNATLIQLVAACGVLLPYSLVSGEFSGLSVNAFAAVLLIILGVLHTGIAFWFYFSSIRGINAQTVAVLSYIDPLTAILLSVLILHETMDVWQVMGAILIIGSTFLSEVAGKIGKRNVKETQ